MATGGTAGVTQKRRQVGGNTIHKAMAEDQVAGGTTFPVEKDLSKIKGSVDSMDRQIHVSRPAYTVSQLRSNLSYASPEEHTLLASASRRLRSCVTCSTDKVWALLLLRVPILSWLPRYKYKEDSISDLIAGLTVGVMHLPQGMGYAMLAEVPPILGLYTAFFPVLIYVIFGTSRHISMGAFAVGCLITGKIVLALSSPTTTIQHTNATDFAGSGNTTVYAGGGVADEVHFTNIQVATAAAFMVGAWQTIFALLQLGKMCVFLPDMLISGFTTGAAFHVLSTQMKNMLGIKFKLHSGPLYLIYMYIDVFKLLPTANVATVIMSAICITVLGINNEVVKPYVKKFSNIPIPVDLFVIIICTAVSYFTQLDKSHGLIVVGHIPTGLPSPVFPDYRLFMPMLVDCFLLAIVIYVISYSLARTFSKKHGYKVDATQELYAGGFGNIFGSLFSIVPASACLSRSVVQETAGCKTQVTSLVSCSVLIVVILFVGPVFQSLPNSVLACIIVVALKGMFLQVFDFLKMWKQSKEEALLWMVTFLVTVLVDIDYGLGAGVLFNIMILLNRNNKPTVTRLGWVPKTDIYVNIDTYQSAVPVPGACLCNVSGALYSANVDYFREQLMKVTGLDTTQIIAAKAMREKKEKKKAALHNLPIDDGVTSAAQDTTEEGVDNTAGGSSIRRRDQIIVIEHSSHKKEPVVLFRGSGYACEDGQQAGVDERKEEQGHENKAYTSDNVHMTDSDCKSRPLGLLKRFTHSSKGLLVLEQDVSFVVLCLSGVGWMDVSAAKNMAALYTEHGDAGISLALAGANDAVMRVLRLCGVLDTIPEHKLYHTLHDAVTSLVADGLHSTPQPLPFVEARNGVEGPLRTTHDAKPAVVPDMLNSHTLPLSSGVPAPIS